MSIEPPIPSPPALPAPTSPERLRLIREVSNRLLIALAVLSAVFIPAGLLAYYQPSALVGVTPLMTLMVGFFGGFVGLQKRLRQAPDDDLRLMAQSWVYTCLSPFVGGILAGLTYILFVSGLLSGDLFPHFVPDAAGPPVRGASPEGIAALFDIHGQATDYAKLIFWCFLAGYSERFVTDILGQFESKA